MTDNKALLEKLMTIAHAAFHALDDCEDRGEEGAVIMEMDFKALSAALDAAGIDDCNVEIALRDKIAAEAGVRDRVLEEARDVVKSQRNKHFYHPIYALNAVDDGIKKLKIAKEPG